MAYRTLGNIGRQQKSMVSAQDDWRKQFQSSINQQNRNQFGATSGQTGYQQSGPMGSQLQASGMNSMGSQTQDRMLRNPQTNAQAQRRRTMSSPQSSYPGMNQNQANDLASRMGWNTAGFNPSNYQTPSQRGPGGYAGGNMTTGALNALGISSNQYQDMQNTVFGGQGQYGYQQGGQIGPGRGGSSYGGGYNSGYNMPSPFQLQQPGGYNAGQPIGQGPGQQMPTSLGGWNVYDQNVWRDPDARPAINSYLENYEFPSRTLAQNAFQYGQDFSEGQRRWNAQYGLESNNQAFNQQLGLREQLFNEQTADIANQQWGAEFGQSQLRDDRSWELALKELGLDTIVAEAGITNDMNAQQAQEARWNAQSQIENKLADAQARYQEGQIGVAEYEAETGRLRQAADAINQAGMLGVSQQEANTGQYQAETNRAEVQNMRDYQMGQLGLGAESNRLRGIEADIERMRVTGQITNEQAALELQRVDEEAARILARQQFGLESELGRRGMNLSERELALMDAYRNRQLQQEAQLTREGHRSQEQQAAMAAFGRRAAPASRYIRNWG